MQLKEHFEVINLPKVTESTLTKKIVALKNEHKIFRKIYIAWSIFFDNNLPHETEGIKILPFNGDLNTNEIKII